MLLIFTNCQLLCYRLCLSRWWWRLRMVGSESLYKQRWDTPKNRQTPYKNSATQKTIMRGSACHLVLQSKSLSELTAVLLYRVNFSLKEGSLPVTMHCLIYRIKLPYFYKIFQCRKVNKFMLDIYCKWSEWHSSTTNLIQCIPCNCSFIMNEKLHDIAANTY